MRISSNCCWDFSVKLVDLFEMLPLGMLCSIDSEGQMDNNYCLQQHLSTQQRTLGRFVLLSIA